MKFDVNQWSTKLLYLLLATDIIFIILHIIYTYTGLIPTIDVYTPLSLDIDRGYSEIFQYIKEYWIALILILLGLQKRSLLYLSWSLLFFYLLLDDSIQIHEKLGLIIGNRLTLSSKFGLRPQDFGEFAVSAAIGLFFLIIIATTYRFSDSQPKQASRYLIAMLFILAFFGIFVDMLDMAIATPIIKSWLATIEDGGELICMSFITGFVFLLPERSHSRHAKSRRLVMTNHNLH